MIVYDVVTHNRFRQDFVTSARSTVRFLSKAQADMYICTSSCSHPFRFWYQVNRLELSYDEVFTSKRDN